MGAVVYLSREVGGRQQSHALSERRMLGLGRKDLVGGSPR